MVSQVSGSDGAYIEESKMRRLAWQVSAMLLIAAVGTALYFSLRYVQSVHFLAKLDPGRSAEALKLLGASLGCAYAGALCVEIFNEVAKKIIESQYDIEEEFREKMAAAETQALEQRLAPVIPESSNWEAFCRWSSLKLQASQRGYSENIGFFEADKLIAPSGNHGKRSDFDRMYPLYRSEEFSQRAKQFDVTVGPHLLLDPFGRGVCGGSCLVFARHYLEKRDMNAAANLFSAEGAPFEAVAMQAILHKIFKLPGRYVLDSFHAMSGLKCSKYWDLTYDDAIAFGGEGVYKCSIPTSDDGTERHAIVMIKDQNGCMLFDPNFGTGPATLKQALDFYKCTPDRTQKSKVTIDRFILGHYAPIF